MKIHIFYKWHCDCGKIGVGTTSWDHAYSMGTFHSELHDTNSKYTWTINKEELKVVAA